MRIIGKESHIKIIFVLLTVLCLGRIPEACCADALHDHALNQLIKKVKVVYGINLHYAEGPASKFIGTDYRLAAVEDKQTLKKTILIFVQEISLYPKDFFRYARCQDIYFVRKLFYKQKPVDGFFSKSSNYIFYDYSRDSNNTQRIRHKIHHEIYHLVGSKHPFWKDRGPAWEALNSVDFSYNQKYSRHERNPINFFAPSEPGFITDYAMSSAEEDRAEVFACMMLPEELRLLEQWAKKDKILFKKVAMMKEFLTGLE